jgi:hypothetical protein
MKQPSRNTRPARSLDLAAARGGIGTGSTDADSAAAPAEKTKHDTVKNSISNVR